MDGWVDKWMDDEMKYILNNYYKQNSTGLQIAKQQIERITTKVLVTILMLSNLQDELLSLQIYCPIFKSKHCQNFEWLSLSHPCAFLPKNGFE